MPAKDACEAGENCPGSDVYVYESTNDMIVCCWCRLSTTGRDFECKTPEEMQEHLREHVKAGHHVRPTLYDQAARERQYAYLFGDDPDVN